MYCTIVPDYILKKIVEKGTPEQKERALRALGIDERTRDKRLRASKEVRKPKPPKKPAKVRIVYDEKNSEVPPGVLVLNEGGKPTESDPDIKRAYDYTGATWDVYSTFYQRNSIDNAGMPIISCVHFGEQWQNACWDGSEMLYGDGDGEIFADFTIDIDVIAHELTHGVTQYTCNLVYEFQPGALNESISDVFGTVVKQWYFKQSVTQADWLIGENVLVGPFSLRSMKAPGTAYVDHPILGTDPQPAEMKYFLKLSMEEDNGGVHLNSGIPNRAFYLSAVGIGGNSWEKAGLIWYKTITQGGLRPTANFKTFANTTIKVASVLYGKKSNEYKAVSDAWHTVGVI
jgi:Zn-dependent metalloprotease